MEIIAWVLAVWLVWVTSFRPLGQAPDHLIRHRFPLLMYSPDMAVMAAVIGMHSTVPLSLGILEVVVLLAALAAIGYFIGREYVGRRSNRRSWN